MTFYKVTVPPTDEMGSYSARVSDDYETKAAAALWDYNSARAHDGLEPLKRMPRGTVYTKIVEYVLLANYGHGDGWEEETIESTRKEILERLKEYRENAPQYSYRWISRPYRGPLNRY